MSSQLFLSLSKRDFQRRFGVKRQTFHKMVQAVKCQLDCKVKRGKKPKLCIEEQILVTLEYWREYRTYFHIGTSWGVSESTVCRIVHRIENQLMASRKFRLQGKKALIRGFSRPQITVMDVTETPIERPKRKQRKYYSGKKKYHTLKTQLIINQETGEIICLFFGKGRGHDFSLFKASGVYFHDATTNLADSGYQGINKYHGNSFTPRKKPKNGELSSLEKGYNRFLAKERIIIEHINRRLKIFKILGNRYRNRRRRYGLRCNLLAAIYNHELSLSA